jgi:hypothetical protein
VKVLAIDPGSEESALLLYAPGTGDPVEWFDTLPNPAAIERIRHFRRNGPEFCDVLAMEMVASYGMPVGREVFDTVLWAGRMIEAWGPCHQLVYRKDVKMHLCARNNAKDPNIRQALIDKFGPGSKRAAIGQESIAGAALRHQRRLLGGAGRRGDVRGDA